MFGSLVHSSLARASPSLKPEKKPYAALVTGNYHPLPNGSVVDIKVPYHDAHNLGISDYFSALGYILAHLGGPESNLSFVHLLQLLSQYAAWCRLSASALRVNPPTVVQLLWVCSPQYRFGGTHVEAKDGLFCLSSSVSPGKGDGLKEVRNVRVRELLAVWPDFSLLSPTPVQQAHAESGLIKSVDSSAELFGTPWGHCGESVSFAASSMHRTMKAGVPMGTLALSVKAMTSKIAGTNIVPAQAIQQLTRLSDIVEVFRTSGALRPMCLNCQYLSSGRIEDYAYKLAGSQLLQV
ncbi:hypothetical protein FISHEDRAFT_59610 [Fistulina hepatica ATCC 64428]|uniref:Uncharacterized protein n=1 Tax=Fistulina hepatica ATCC 64428 TaxID=1128425 RepID=A0A0D7AC33_9AGAR|nr:hypothetical protein FISHEDRAFT_59610 [Fistulina hepatica ATCC 64428]